VTGWWRKLHNEESCDLHSSPSIIRIIKSKRVRWAGHVARMREKNAYRLLVGKRPLGRLSRRWVDNIKIDLGEREWGGVDGIGLAQNRDNWRALVNSINAGKLLSGFTTGGLWSSAQLHRVRYLVSA
jgi:hypothetical protein